jgi:hypothetical protein
VQLQKTTQDRDRFVSSHLVCLAVSGLGTVECDVHASAEGLLLGAAREGSVHPHLGCKDLDLGLGSAEKKWKKSGKKHRMRELMINNDEDDLEMKEK